MNILLVFLLSTLASYSFAAGTETGNGGDIIVCSNTQSPHHLKVLDTYEAQRMGMTPVWGNSSNYLELVEIKLQKWKKTAPKRMAQYLEWLEDFEQEAGFGDVDIPDTPDHGHIVIPRGCRIQQVVMQRGEKIIFPGVKRYELDSLYWSQLDTTQKAALVLHELIYREAIASHHKTSIPTRYFNALLMSEDMDPIKYFQTVVQMPFEYAEFYGVVADNGKYRCRETCQWIKQIELHPNGLPKAISARVIDGNDIVLKNLKCENPKYSTISIGYARNGYIDYLSSLICMKSLSLNITSPDKTRIWHIQSFDLKSLVNFNFKNFPDFHNPPSMHIKRVIIRYDNAFFKIVFGADESGFINGLGWIPLIKKPSFGNPYIDGSYFKIGNQVFSNPHAFEYRWRDGINTVTSFRASGKKWQYNEETKNWEAD